MSLKHLKFFKNFTNSQMSNEQYVVLVFDNMEKPLGQIEGFTEKEISIFVESGRHNFYQSDVFKTFLEEKNIDVEEIDSLVVARKIISDTEELCFEHTPYQFRK